MCQYSYKEQPSTILSVLSDSKACAHGGLLQEGFLSSAVKLFLY